MDIDLFALAVAGHQQAGPRWATVCIGIHAVAVVSANKTSTLHP